MMKDVRFLHEEGRLFVEMLVEGEWEKREITDYMMDQEVVEEWKEYLENEYQERNRRKPDFTMKARVRSVGKLDKKARVNEGDEKE